MAMPHKLQPKGLESQGQGGGEGTGGEPERRQHCRVERGWGAGRDISREWKRPGLSLQSKRTPRIRHKAPEDTNKRRVNREDKEDAQGTGDHKEHNTNPLVPPGEWATSRYRKGGSGREGKRSSQRKGWTLVR